MIYYNMSYVYLLLATPRRDATYVGATVDLERRLRQHNKEIKDPVLEPIVEATISKKIPRKFQENSSLSNTI